MTDKVVTEQDLDDISHELSEAKPEVLDAIANDPAMKEYMLSVSQKGWSGPIPSPEDLKAINDVVPGAGGKIVDAGIRSMDANNENRRALMRYNLMALVFAGIITLTFLIISSILILNDKYLEGSIFGAAPVVATILGFFFLKNQDKK